MVVVKRLPSCDIRRQRRDMLVVFVTAHLYWQRQVNPRGAAPPASIDARTDGR